MAASLAFALLLQLVAPATDSVHPHPAHARQASTIAPRYAADPALREAMGRVRVAVEAFVKARDDRATAPQVQALADRLDAAIVRVINECRLPADADASMHVLLGMLHKAANAARETPGDLAPVDAMERALADYARMFETP